MTNLHPIFKYPDDDFTQLCLWCDTEIDHDISNICDSEKCKAKGVE